METTELTSCAEQTRQGIMNLAPEIRTTIWKMLVLQSDILLQKGRYGRYPRPAILKVCRALENEISPMLWGGNLVELEDYSIPDFIRDWGLKTLHMVRHLIFTWSSDSNARVNQLEWKEVSTIDFTNLQTLEICLLGRLTREETYQYRHPIGDSFMAGFEWSKGRQINLINAQTFMKRLQMDSRLPNLKFLFQSFDSRSILNRNVTLRLTPSLADDDRAGVRSRPPISSRDTS